MRYIAAAIVFGILLLTGVILFTGDDPKDEGDNAGSSGTTSQTTAPAQDPHLTTFDLSGKELTEYPPYLYDRADLTSLNLSNNQLTQLPGQISNLESLEDFNLENNRLQSVPKEIGELKKLRILNLGNNRLTNLPLEIGQLKNLETLDLTGYTGSTTNLNEIKRLLPNLIVKM